MQDYCKTWPKEINSKWNKSWIIRITCSGRKIKKNTQTYKDSTNSYCWARFLDKTDPHDLRSLSNRLQYSKIKGCTQTRDSSGMTAPKTPSSAKRALRLIIVGCQGYHRAPTHHLPMITVRRWSECGVCWNPTPTKRRHFTTTNRLFQSGHPSRGVVAEAATYRSNYSFFKCFDRLITFIVRVVFCTGK